MNRATYLRGGMMGGNELPGMVRTLDEQLALFEWPEAKRVEEIAIGPGDCLVAAMGFEDRAMAGLERVSGGSGQFSVAMVRYLPEVAENRERQFLDLTETHSLDVRQFEYNRERPAGMGLVLGDYAAGYDRVYVDVSGMSRLLIVQMLVALAEREKDCVILYSEADVYPPLKEEFEESREDGGTSPPFISSGVLEVVSSPELSSVAMLGSPIRLVSFLSFDPSQLSNLVQEIQPTHNNVVRGRSPHAEMAWRTNAVEQMNEPTVNMLQRVKIHEACTFDYRMTLDLIVDLYKQHSAFDRIVVAPTGSKMQAVAIGIVRGVLTDLQIVYPTPRQFLDPGRYTVGVRDVFQLPLRWGALSGR